MKAAAFFVVASLLVSRGALAASVSFACQQKNQDGTTSTVELTHKESFFGGRSRIFLGKTELHFSPGRTNGLVMLYERHPSALQYNEAGVDLVVPRNFLDLSMFKVDGKTWIDDDTSYDWSMICRRLR